jgi:hypothetical protein
MHERDVTRLRELDPRTAREARRTLAGWRQALAGGRPGGEDERFFLERDAHRVMGAGEREEGCAPSEPAGPQGAAL